MNIGFTGTKRGMRAAQIKALTHLLMFLLRNGDEFHHGDCEGADVEAAGCAKDLGYFIVCHPPINPKHRGWFEKNDKIHSVFDYIVRDRHIVDGSQILIAAPHTGYEITRSGTWTTVRYARSLNRRIYIIKPDGVVEVQL